MPDEEKPILATCEPLHLIGENDFGQTLELLNTISNKLLLAYRKAGSVSGNHYHTGNEDSKNPEILYLIAGEVQLELEHLPTGLKEGFPASAPCKVQIYPNTLHRLLAKTDIIFLEMNSLEEHQRDTLYP